MHRNLAKKYIRKNANQNNKMNIKYLGTNVRKIVRVLFDEKKPNFY